MLVRLDQVGKNDVPTVGGKAANLGEMLRAGIALPPGYCLTAEAYRCFVDRSGLWPGVEAALREVARADLSPTACQAASSHIRERFEASPLPDQVAACLGQVMRELGPDTPLAVRSSATAEDLAEASFAGQQESFLNVRGEESVARHVLLCWSSLWTARAIAYRARQGFGHASVALAVVLQAMVVPEVAGVLFTVNPLSGRTDEMLVNASWGLGEAIVSGRVTPDSFRLARRGLRPIRQATLGSKEHKIVPRAEGGTRTEPVPPADQIKPCLEKRALLGLRDLGERVESHYGSPQDIEWAMVGPRLYLLQTRPITAVCARPRPLSGLRRAIQDDILEHYPDAPFPLECLAVTEGYEQLQHMVRMLGVRLPPAESIIRMDEEGVCQVDPATPVPTKALLALPWRVVSLLRLDPGQWRRPDLSRLQAFPLEQAEDPALAAHLRAALDLAARTAHTRFCDVIAPMMLRGAWLAVLARLAGQRADPFQWLGGLSTRTIQIEYALQALADTLPDDGRARAALDSHDLEGLRSALAGLPAGQAFLGSLEAFLRDHGARAMQAYLPFAHRSWRESPAAFLATLAAVVRAGTPGAAERRFRGALEAFERLRSQVARRLAPPLRGWFERTLQGYRAGHVAREETLYAVEEAFVQARRAADLAARRLTERGILRQPEDIRLLRAEELCGLFGGQLDPGLERRLDRRRERRAAAEAAWANLRRPAEVTGADCLTGVAGSPGLATGPARVIRGVEDFERLQAGDILVCPFTDPTWTPLFSLARAVVADTGGPLSHAAIVAREYEIPAVLGTGVGTSWVAEGEQLEVDAFRGRVRRLASNSSGQPGAERPGPGPEGGT